MPDKPIPEWERLLSSAEHLQKIVPGAVLIGGTAAATYAHHRISVDHVHVLTDLRERFDAILFDLESVAGWQTARVRRPVLILGSLDGIETGVRQLISPTFHVRVQKGRISWETGCRSSLHFCFLRCGVA